MTLEKIFDDVKAAFGSLWSSKKRGNSLEIITPYATTNNRFVSVFITKQNNEYIITDGGWINAGIYETGLMSDESYFLKILYHYQNTFEIKEIKAPDGSQYYYVKCKNIIDIPSKVFDLSIFIQNIVSACEISFDSKEEKETKERFVSKANDYLKSFTNPKKIKFSTFLNPNKKEIKFNAIYSKTPSKISLVNYITGSSIFYFTNSISKSNMLFEMAGETNFKNHIDDKVALIDTSAEGYSQEKLANYLYHLENHTRSMIVNWSEREKLQSILN